MNLHQWGIIAILIGMISLFVWTRLRYDLVALLGLAVALATGIIPLEKAFEGFRDQIVIIVTSALVISAAISKSGLVQAALRPLSPYMRNTASQIAVLGVIVAIFSAFTKNIGALAAFMPSAIQLAHRNGYSASRVLMPLSFAALLGGLCTLVGTSPNIVVSRIREQIVGKPFQMFDFAPVGLGITIVGLLFLTIGWWLLRDGRKAPTDRAFEITEYTTEARLSAASPMVGKTVADLERLGDKTFNVVMIIRADQQGFVPNSKWVLMAGDILLLQGDANRLKQLTDEAGLELEESKPLHLGADKGLLTITEAVIMPDSSFVDHSLAEVRLRDRYSVNVIALSRSGEILRERLGQVKFRAGDVLLLEGRDEDVSELLSLTGLLPLAERNIQLRKSRRRFVAPAVLFVALTLTATGNAPAEVAFFCAAVCIVALGALSLQDAYESIEWPLIMLLGTMIPLSDALRTTGVTDLAASLLTAEVRGLPPFLAVLVVMVVAMVVTPFLNNAATVLVLAPIASGLALSLELRPDPFLMAVAIGAGSDFLTPIGHQCNTLVMGPGGYAFGDYWRLGLPLSLLVAVTGTALITLFWPFA